MRRPTLDRPPRFEPRWASPDHLILESDCAALAHIYVLEEDIIRVLVLPDGELKQPRTWAIAPGADDVPDEGRHRLALTGFSAPAPVVRLDGRSLVLETRRIRLSIALNDFKCRWQILDKTWKNAALDRPTQAYDFGWWDGRPRHYLTRDADELYFGLGEKSGDLNRAGRRLRMCNLDALGYDARTSDPLYKHIPFYITRRPHEAVSFGLFYDTLSDCAFDLGCERDNYHGPYRAFEAEHGDLDYYFIAGPDLGDVVRRFTWMTGRPALMPDWSLGYSGSSMALADAPDAEARLLGFLDECAARDIPCPSFHLSSGYTEQDGRRYVFTWNRDKHPEPAGFVKAFAERGVRIAANVKPALLQSHPMYDEARSLGLLIAEPAGAPALCQFWDGLGALLDFTNPNTILWWKAHVREALLDLGVRGVWNDNNEFEIFSPTALAKGLASPARETRALQPLLMMRASRQAQIEQEPDKRPFVVSRSGSVGMHRYAQTWSGDNATSWETLRYNIKMGLGLALSGISNCGHDVGGFAGPAPDPELFARWVELGVFMPRFSIHSWNDDGSVNSPWMHESVADTVAGLIRLRGRLAPYLRYLSWRYAHDFEPIWRPTLYDFPDDPACWEEGDDFMLGPSLLVAPVVSPGTAKRAVRLPAGADWTDPWTGSRHTGGRTVVLDAPLGRPPILARTGAIIPINRAPARFGEERIDPGFMLFPPDRGSMSIDFHIDDGERLFDVGASQPNAQIVARCDASTIAVTAKGLIGVAQIGFVLPPGETRKLTFPAGETPVRSS